MHDRWTFRVVLALAAALPLAACSSSGGVVDAASDRDLTTSTAEPSTTGAFPTPEVLAACETEQRTLDIAAQAHRAMDGTWPTSVEDMIQAELLRPNTFAYDLVPDGADASAPPQLVVNDHGRTLGCPEPGRVGGEPG